MIQGHERCNDCTETMLVSRGSQNVSYVHFWKCCHCGFGENNYSLHDGCSNCDQYPGPFDEQYSLISFPVYDTTKPAHLLGFGFDEADICTQIIHLAETSHEAVAFQKHGYTEDLLNELFQEVYLANVNQEAPKNDFDVRPRYLGSGDQALDFIQYTSPGPSNISMEDISSGSEWSEGSEDEASDADDLCDRFHDQLDEDLAVSNIRQIVSRIVKKVHSSIQHGDNSVLRGARLEFDNANANNSGYGSLYPPYAPSDTTSTISDTQPTGSSQSSSGIAPESSLTSLGKRGRQDSTSNSLDQEDDADKDETTASKRRRQIIPNEPRLACPYYKRDRWKCTSHRTCAHPGWLSIHRLKEHLYRCHIVYQCGRCSSTFSTDDLLEEHRMSIEPCSLRPKNPAFGVNQAAYNALKSRKRPKGQSVEDQWRNVYRLLFPGSNVPSPYVSEAENDRTMHDSLQQHVMEHYQTELSQLLPTRLSAAFRDHFGDDRFDAIFPGDQFQDLVQNIVQDVTALRSYSLEAVVNSMPLRLSTTESTMVITNSQEPCVESSTRSTERSACDPTFDLLDIDKLINESLCELGNEMITEAIRPQTALLPDLRPSTFEDQSTSLNMSGAQVPNVISYSAGSSATEHFGPESIGLPIEFSSFDASGIDFGFLVGDFTCGEACVSQCE